MSINVDGCSSLYQHENPGVDGKCKISPKFINIEKLVDVEQIEAIVWLSHFFQGGGGGLFDMCRWSCSDGARLPGISPTVDMCLSLSNSNNQNVQILFSQIR